MKSDQWKTYRTRFLVKAKQLNSTLAFTDHLGRQHCGRKGDYLVESCDGVLSIAPRQIFEDIYVSMIPDVPGERIVEPATLESLALKHLHFESPQIEKIGPVKFHHRARSADGLRSDASVRRRKSPQPVRETPVGAGRIPKFQVSKTSSFPDTNALVF